MASILEKIQEITAEKLSVDIGDVNPDSSFTEDLEADSLDVVELIMALEEEFSTDDNAIEISDEDAENIINTVIDSPYTRIPVWQNDAENIIGIIHAKNLLRLISSTRDKVISKEDIKKTLLYSYINQDDSRVRISARVLESAKTLNRNELLEKI